METSGTDFCLETIRLLRRGDDDGGGTADPDAVVEREVEMGWGDMGRRLDVKLRAGLDVPSVDEDAEERL